MRASRRGRLGGLDARHLQPEPGMPARRGLAGLPRQFSAPGCWGGASCLTVGAAPPQPWPSRGSVLRPRVPPSQACGSAACPPRCVLTQTTGRWLSPARLGEATDRGSGGARTGCRKLLETRAVPGLESHPHCRTG